MGVDRDGPPPGTRVALPSSGVDIIYIYIYIYIYVL